MLISSERYSIEQLTTSEMTPQEFEEYKAAWIRSNARTLQQSQVSAKVAVMTAQSSFELMVKNKFQKRDAFVLKLRADRQNKTSVLTKWCR
jgi:hypothetical protein